MQNHPLSMDIHVKWSFFDVFN